MKQKAWSCSATLGVSFHRSSNINSTNIFSVIYLAVALMDMN